jgi:Ca-activated chloride channel family protein
MTPRGFVKLAAAGVVAIAAVVIALGFLDRPPTPLAIVSGSENEALEPIVSDWATRNNVDLQITYLGSIDISRELAKGPDSAFDAVWPANSLWIELGDRRKVVRHTQSILRSPVVLGLKRSIAERLGWIGRDDVTIQMIQEAASSGAFRLAMTSATQSNSGASAYIGFLYAMAGDPDLLTLEILQHPQVQEGVRDLLAQVDRSSGSSGWLKDALIANPDAYDAMFNYEAVILEANAALTRDGREPLYIIYPANGLSVADSPLGFIAKGDAAREEAFLKLQAYLLSEETQQKLAALGRRTGLIGLAAEGADPRVWNRDWGVDLARAIAPVPTPSAEVIAEALRLYQTELRKPSLTVWVLDVSGSMEGAPLAQLKEAMGLLLDPEASAVSLLQPSRRDVTIVLPFNHGTLPPFSVTGANPEELAGALAKVRALQADGGTDLYSALMAALDLLEPYAANGTLGDYLPAIVAMTDGASETVNRDAMLRYLASKDYGRDVPIHAIAFGEADEQQLGELNDATIGRLFLAGDDLAGALRQAKSYN